MVDLSRSHRNSHVSLHVAEKETKGADFSSRSERGVIASGGVRPEAGGENAFNSPMHLMFKGFCTGELNFKYL